ncbi:putative cytochrome P450 hydroxylase [freshwater metagenome]|jgi:cytochrome P450|uniref:Putative cytochrome P450 hydroxylase n=1 Tax=freshwater metagenome TaxID=449393 RepID=A0A094S5B9_9ZZZZ
MATLASDLSLPEIPVIMDQSRTDRHQFLRDVAGQSWLAKTEIGYSVLTYESVMGILRDKRWQSAVGFIAQLQGITNETFMSRRRESILSAEGEVHVRLRRLVAPAFSPRSADRLRPFMREVVNGLIDDVAQTGRAEVVRDICEPYPIPIICELLGAPKEDWKLFSRLATDVLRIFGSDLATELPTIMAAQEELDEYTRGLIAERRSVPLDDLLTDLISAEEAGDKLSNEELVMMVEAVIVGGTDTTRNQLGLALALFAEHPDQWELLRNDPSLAPRAVEEVMRYNGAVGGTIRYASEDIEYNGVLFPKGTFMSTSMATGNFDASVFPEPNTFNIMRPPVGQPHLSLGAGIHYCLGASLARAELQEAFTVLSERMPQLRLDGPVEYKSTGVGIFGPASLPIAFNTK